MENQKFEEVEFTTRLFKDSYISEYITIRHEYPTDTQLKNYMKSKAMEKIGELIFESNFFEFEEKEIKLLEREAIVYRLKEIYIKE